MQISVSVDASKVQSVLKSVNDGMADYSKLLKEFSKIQLESADEAFKTRGRNIGMPWEKLKSSTVKEKLRIGKNIDILQRSGTMRKSFKVQKLTKNELEIGNTIKYFKYHQLGTQRIPQRQMLGHSPQLVKRYEIEFINYILKLIQK